MRWKRSGDASSAITGHGSRALSWPLAAVDFFSMLNAVDGYVFGMIVDGIEGSVFSLRYVR